MIPRQADVRFTVVVLVLAVVALLFGGQLIVDPPISLSADLLAMSPRVFPFLILGGTVVVASAFLVGQARKGALEMTRFSLGSGVSASLGRQVAVVFITRVGALLLTTLGFITTMFLLMASTAVLVGNRNPLQILIISIFIPLGFYIVVTHVLRTALPEVDIIQRLLAPVFQLLPAF